MTFFTSSQLKVLASGSQSCGVISDSDLPEPHGLLPKCHLLSPSSRQAASIKTLYCNPAGLEQNPAACDMWHLAQAHAALTRQDLTERFAVRIMNAAAL